MPKKLNTNFNRCGDNHKRVKYSIEKMMTVKTSKKYSVRDIVGERLGSVSKENATNDNIINA